MRQTSAGSGTPNDRNDNPSSQEATESDAVNMPSPLKPGSEQDTGTSNDMPFFPDGPNVAPSAWELQVARGQPDPQDPAPDTAEEL